MLWQRRRAGVPGESKFFPLMDALLVVALVLICTLATAVSECGDVQASEQRSACVVEIAAYPRAVVSVGPGACEPPFVGNVPDGWPLLRGPGTWPEMVPGSCSEVGICRWVAVLDGSECAAVRGHPMVVRRLIGGR